MAESDSEKGENDSTTIVTARLQGGLAERFHARFDEDNDVMSRVVRRFLDLGLEAAEYEKSPAELHTELEHLRKENRELEDRRDDLKRENERLGYRRDELKGEIESLEDRLDNPDFQDWWLITLRQSKPFQTFLIGALITLFSATALTGFLAPAMFLGVSIPSVPNPFVLIVLAGMTLGPVITMIGGVAHIFVLYK